MDSEGGNGHSSWPDFITESWEWVEQEEIAAEERLLRLLALDVEVQSPLKVEK